MLVLQALLGGYILDHAQLTSPFSSIEQPQKKPLPGQSPPLN